MCFLMPMKEKLCLWDNNAFLQNYKDQNFVRGFVPQHSHFGNQSPKRTYYQRAYCPGDTFAHLISLLSSSHNNTNASWKIFADGSLPIKTSFADTVNEIPKSLQEVCSFFIHYTRLTPQFVQYRSSIFTNSRPHLMQNFPYKLKIVETSPYDSNGFNISMSAISKYSFNMLHRI